MATLRLSLGANILARSAAGDLVFGEVADLKINDRVTAGGGNTTDTLRLITSGTIDARAGGNAMGYMGFERIDLAAGGTSRLFLADDLVMSSYAGTASAGWISVFSGGSDLIDGSAITNGAGRVQIFAGGGTDTLLGGIGNDVFRFNAADLTAADTVDGGAGLLDRITLDSAGTLAVDAFDGVRRIERLMLHADGNAVVLGEATLASADATLAVFGAAGNDRVDASGATAKLGFIPGAGHDGFLGGGGDDQINIALADLTAADAFDGGGGRDRLSFTTAGTITPDLLAGLSDIEVLSLWSGGPNTVTLGTNLADVTVTGGSLTDTVTVALPTQSVRLGGGDDMLIVTAAAVPASTGDGADGVDTIATVGGGTFTFGAGFAGFERLVMGAAATIDLSANAMNLALTGSAGRDTVVIGTGSYVLDGGAGNDTLLLGASGMTATLATAGEQHTGHGTLTVRGFEHLAGGVGHDTLVGSSGNNTLDAGAGDDTVHGGAGNDTLRGGAGHDTLLGGNGNDTLSGGPGYDLLDGGIFNDTASYAAAAGSVTASLADNEASHDGDGAADQFEGIENLTGSAFADALTGNDANNVLNGLAGADTLEGGAGSDRLNGGDGADLLLGGDGEDLMAGGAGNDILVGGLGPDRLDGGSGNDRFRYLARDEGGDLVGNFAAGGIEDGFDLQKSAFPLHGTAQGGGWAAIKLFVQIGTSPVAASVNVLARAGAGLDTAAGVDAYAEAEHPVAGGMLLLTQVATGQAVMLWYDPNAALVGGADAPLLLATMPDITTLPGFTSSDFFGV